MKEVMVRAKATTRLMDNNEEKLPSDKITANATINEPGKYNPKYTIHSRNEAIKSPASP